MPPPDLQPREHAVLVLHPGRVEWLERGAHGLLHGSAELPPEGISGLAAAALAARSAAGGKLRSVVLALAEGRVALRLLSLPELPQAELARVLVRKACALAEAQPQDVLYAARSFGAGQRWLVAAARRHEVAAWIEALARRRIRVRRVVPERLAALDAAGLADAQGEARLCLQRDGAGVALWLWSRGEPLHLGALVPGAGGEPALALAVLQEARSCAAFARRTQRGAGVQQISIEGFAPELAARLERALAADLPGARSERREPALLIEQRWAGALAGSGPRLDLRPEPRLRLPRALLWIAAALAVMLGLAAVTSAELRLERERLASERGALDQRLAERERAAGAEARAQRLAACERRLVALELREHAAGAFPAELELVLEALGSDAALLALEGSAEGELRLDGLVDARPLVALGALERVRRRLARGAGGAELRIDLDGTQAAAGTEPGAQLFHLRRGRAP